MKVSRHLRMSFLAVFALCLVVALSSCSKKEVVQDEPGFSTMEDSGDGMAMGEMGDEGSATDFGGGAAAGDAGGAMGAGELQTVYFPFDSYNLTSEARESLKFNSQWLRDNPSATIQIEGHCDERGTIEYNIALGERRANSTMGYMEQLGVEPSRMSVISYGEERPAELGSSESAWARNRRAEFVILSQ